MRVLGDNTMNTAALLYLRGTDAKCAEQRTAITNAYAKRFDFVRVFEDESPSNSYLQSRPGGKKLIAALLESSVRVVLVTQPLMIAAQKQCVDFLFFCERMAEGVQVLTLDGVDLVAGLQANKRRLKAEGKRIAGKLPYGHGSDPKERAVLTRMLAMKAEGVSA